MKISIPKERLTPEQFKAVAKYKGWKFRMLAERWGVTPEWISNISRDPQRDLRFDDALLGLPNLNKLGRDLKARTRQIDIALNRQAGLARKARTFPVMPGYRYREYFTLGAVVTASADIGSMAEEGVRGIVFQILDDGMMEKYGVIFESGLWDWFTPDYIDVYLVTTGLISAGLTSYQYRDEQILQSDFRAGLFEFWPAV